MAKHHSPQGGASNVTDYHKLAETWAPLLAYLYLAIALFGGTYALLSKHYQNVLSNIRVRLFPLKSWSLRSYLLIAPSARSALTFANEYLINAPAFQQAQLPKHYIRDNQVIELYQSALVENHSVILEGDSGVGKTTFLTNYHKLSSNIRDKRTRAAIKYVFYFSRTNYPIRRQFSLTSALISQTRSRFSFLKKFYIRRILSSGNTLVIFDDMEHLKQEFLKESIERLTKSNPMNTFVLATTSQVNPAWINVGHVQKLFIKKWDFNKSRTYIKSSVSSKCWKENSIWINQQDVLSKFNLPQQCVDLTKALSTGNLTKEVRSNLDISSADKTLLHIQLRQNKESKDFHLKELGRAAALLLQGVSTVREININSDTLKLSLDRGILKLNTDRIEFYSQRSENYLAGWYIGRFWSECRDLVSNIPPGILVWSLILETALEAAAPELKKEIETYSRNYRLR